MVDKSFPAPRNPAPWTAASHGRHGCSLDGRLVSGIRRPVTSDDQGASPIIAQGSKTLSGKQVAFDAEMTAIEDNTWSSTQTRSAPSRGPATPAPAQANGQPWPFAPRSPPLSKQGG
jgi:hypothetical protein